MGLLDALFQNNSGGGLLDSLMYGTQRPGLITPSFGPNGEFDASMFRPKDPFGPVPNLMQAPQPPPSVFATGTQGINASGPSGPMPGMFAPQQAQAPQMPPAPHSAPVQPPAAPAPQNNAINTMDVGGYQMPQFGSVQDYTPQNTIPANAQPAQMQPQQQPTPSFLGGEGAGFGDRLSAGMNNFANAGGPLQALVGGIGGLMNGQRTDAAGMQQQNLRAQYQAFIGAGLSPQKAMLAVMNPEAGKTLISEALTNKEKWGEIGSDSFGNKQFGWINDREQTINGKPMGSEGANGSSMGFLADGIKQVDSSLKGQDYLNQFSPEVKAAVQNYVDGKSTPTGNPRKGFTQTVKMIAQKYGDDTGQSVDDTTYAARRTMRNQLSSSAPSSLGGQINIGNTAAGHLADLSQKAIELGNVDTGIAPLSAAVNSVRGLGTEQAAKMEALKGAAQHYGQEITKFYAGSPGGVAERDRFIESVSGARSPKELAAILATEGELMRSRLDALGGQIKGVLGEEGAKQYPVLRPDGQTALTKVEENVSRLKGGQGAGSPGLPSGWTVKVR